MSTTFSAECGCGWSFTDTELKTVVSTGTNHECMKFFEHTDTGKESLLPDNWREVWRETRRRKAGLS